MSKLHTKFNNFIKNNIIESIDNINGNNIIYHVTPRKNKKEILEKGIEKGRLPMWVRGIQGNDIFNTSKRSFFFLDIKDALQWAAKTKIEKDIEVSIVAVNGKNKNLKEDTGLTEQPFGSLESAVFTEDSIDSSDILDAQDVFISFGKFFDENNNPFTEKSFSN